MIKKYLLILILFLTLFLLCGCSNKEDKTAEEHSGKEHILKDQVRVLEKAKGVAKVLNDGSDKRNQEIDEQSK